MRLQPDSSVKLFSWAQPAIKDAEAAALWKQFDREGRAKISV
ncbi:hypothetical protein [Roseateles sp.]|nr:hypothetical protein [Roseateles sp.]